MAKSWENQMLERMAETNASLAITLKGIQDNLQKLNDSNVLHNTNTALYFQKSSDETKSIIDQLKTMTEKYWWLIIVLIGVLLVITGYPQIAKIFLGV